MRRGVSPCLENLTGSVGWSKLFTGVPSKEKCVYEVVMCKRFYQLCSLKLNEMLSCCLYGNGGGKPLKEGGVASVPVPVMELVLYILVLIEYEGLANKGSRSEFLRLNKGRRYDLCLSLNRATLRLIKRG